MAVFRTQPALRIEQKVQAHPIAPRRATYAIRRRELIEQRIVGRREHGARFIACQQLTSE